MLLTDFSSVGHYIWGTPVSKLVRLEMPDLRSGSRKARVVLLTKELLQMHDGAVCANMVRCLASLGRCRLLLEDVLSVAARSLGGLGGLGSLYVLNVLEIHVDRIEMLREQEL